MATLGYHQEDEAATSLLRLKNKVISFLGWNNPLTHVPRGEFVRFSLPRL